MTEHTIDRLGHLGDGIAQTTDGPIFLPRTLPGEVVDVDASGAIRIIAPSDLRVAAECRHYKSCGGCNVQHADAGFVAEWKQGIAVQALAAQGISTEFRPIITSPPNSRRRAGISGKRTKKGAMVGFHPPSAATLIQVPDCQLITPALRAAMPVLEEITRLGASRKAEITLTVTDASPGLDITATGGKPMDSALFTTLAALVANGPITRLTWDGDPVVQEVAPTVDFDGISVPFPPGAFLQATKQGEQTLRDSVGEIIADNGPILDLFAGCGTFALPLARKNAVHAIEGEAEMLEALDQGWRNAKGLRAVTTETRDLFRNPVLAQDLTKYGACVIDPPRAGAEAQMAALAESGIPVIAAVSCNPTTFARDAKLLLAGGYRLDWVQVVDQFRWSAHVELVACFTQSHMPSR